jgi:hypothetical protein
LQPSCRDSESPKLERFADPPVASFLEERLDIAPSRMRLLKLFALLFSALHLCACFFWRVKVGPSLY